MVKAMVTLEKKVSPTGAVQCVSLIKPELHAEVILLTSGYCTGAPTEAGYPGSDAETVAACTVQELLMERCDRLLASGEYRDNRLLRPALMDILREADRRLTQYGAEIVRGVYASGVIGFRQENLILYIPFGGATISRVLGDKRLKRIGGGIPEMGLVCDAVGGNGTEKIRPFTCNESEGNRLIFTTAPLDNMENCKQIIAAEPTDALRNVTAELLHAQMRQPYAGVVDYRIHDWGDSGAEEQ